MTAKMDFIFGHIVFNQGLVSKEELEKCFLLQEQSGFTRPLGEILVEQGLITQAQLEQVLLSQKEKLQQQDPYWKQRRKDDSFGEIAIRRGLVERQAVEKALSEQQQLSKQGEYVRIGTLLIRAGHLKPEQVNEILNWQQECMITCPICSYGIDREQAKEHCPYCGAKLISS